MKPANSPKSEQIPQPDDAWGGTGWGENTALDHSWNLTPVPQDLLDRVDENIRRMELGLEPIYVLSPAERELLRPKGHSTFGVRPDGSIRHCGTLIADLDDLELLRLNNRLRMSAGFPPENLEEIRELLAMSAAGQRLPSPRLRRRAADQESRRQHRAETIRTYGSIRGRVKLLVERFGLIKYWL